jgi:uncharacterized protein (DUF433 family)
MKRTVPGYTRITVDAETLSGQPCVRGMRLTVRRVLEILAQSPDWKALQTDYPDLEREDIPEVLRFAAEMLDERSRRPLACDHSAP